MKILFVVLLFLCVSLSRAEEPFKGFLDAFPDADTSELIKMPETEDFIDVKLPEYAACPTLAVPADTNNVNALKPGHIKAIAAMGDSITCGSAAKDSSLISTKEYRGLSFCIGADAGVTTFTNILKGIIPTLTVNGGSLGTGGRTSTGNGLNAAVSGAVNSDMLSQAKWLVAQMRNATSKVNINSDWKVLTIWIGSNNLCKVCSDATNNNGANYETKVTEALQYLYDNVPRLFVNLVASLDVSKIYGINTGICNTVHSIACSCIMATNNRATVAATAKDYVAKAHTIAKAFNGRRTDFAVVVQPFLANATIADRNLLSAADCFHPSALGHQLASVALWNNMLTPAASKKTTWSTTDTPICPTADSIFPTN